MEKTHSLELSAAGVTGIHTLICFSFIMETWASDFLSPNLNLFICEMGIRMPTSQGVDVWRLIRA